MDAELLVLRGTVGPEVAAHGAGKPFGSFGAGFSPAGTAGYLEGLDSHPGSPYAYRTGLTSWVPDSASPLGWAPRWPVRRSSEC